MKLKVYEKEGINIRYAIVDGHIYYLTNDIGIILDYVYFAGIIRKHSDPNEIALLPCEGNRTRQFVSKKGLEQITVKKQSEGNYRLLMKIIEEIENKENMSKENIKTATFETLWDNASEDVKNAVCQLLLALANQPKVEKKIIKFV